jgi:hypothetical protein
MGKLSRRRATARLALLLPLIWSVLAIGGCASAPRQSVAQERLGQPVAVLATPKKTVQVFLLTEQEHPEWSYMVVHVDRAGSRTTYGDTGTVGALLETLKMDFANGASDTGGRCPAASGWRFESTTVRASFCSRVEGARRIERAVGLLETMPPAAVSASRK